RRKRPTPNVERPMLNLEDGALPKLATGSTDPRASPSMTSKIGCWNLPQISSNSPSRCRIHGRAIISPGSCCDVAHHLFLITEKLKWRNHAEISFTNSGFVSRNCGKPSGGYALLRDRKGWANRQISIP